MHAYTQMKARAELAESKLREVETNLNTFAAFLHSSKFAGVDNDGERKDWIATADVLHFIRETRSLLP